MSAIRSVIRGTGSYLPDRIMSNAEMSTIVDTSDEWIQERTGIRQRHIAADGELTSDLATRAAQAILSDAGIAAEQVDLIVLATTTPDKTFPATATAVQANLGMGDGAAFDVQAVCSGFLFALATADSMLKTGLFKTALVLGAEEKGMRRLTMENCDFLATIPMSGQVECLNVSVATGVCLYEAVRQRQGAS